MEEGNTGNDAADDKRMETEKQVIEEVGAEDVTSLSMKLAENDKSANGTGDDDDDDDIFAGLDDVATMDLYDISNYTFGKKNTESKSKCLTDDHKGGIADSLREKYKELGMRRSVGAVVLVHEHNFPHVLLLQRADGKGEYTLPGGRLRPGESDEDGLLRKLTSKLCPEETNDEEQASLDVGEQLGKWYAIDFSRRYYPYVPAHVSKAKEEVHVYTVAVPNKFKFAVPKNLQLVAVPLFELHHNISTFGSIISAVPALLSKYHINYC